MRLRLQTKGADLIGTPATVTLYYVRDDGAVFGQTVTVPAAGRATVLANSVPGLESRGFSTHVYSTNQVPIVVERVIYWPGVSGASAQAEEPKTSTTDGSLSEAAAASALPSSGEPPPLAYRDAVVGTPANDAARAAYEAWVAAGRPPRTLTESQTLSGGGWYGAHLTGPQP